MGIGTRFVSEVNGASLLLQAVHRGNMLRRAYAAARRQHKFGISEGKQGRRLQVLSNAHVSKWQKVRSFVAAVNKTNTTYSSAKMKGEMRKANSAVASGQVLTVVDHAALAATPLWQQGDTSLYTTDKMEARYALRHHRLVIAELQRWWLTILRSRPKRSVDGIEHDEYIELSKLIFKALIPAYNADDATASAEEDWIADCKGAPFLSRGLFLDSLFELCDVRALAPRRGSNSNHLHGRMVLESHRVESLFAMAGLDKHGRGQRVRRFPAQPIWHSGGRRSRREIRVA
jgi:hypothetical protein